jgi:flagellar basal body rod protein FlgG
MNIGLYQSASALSALERWQENVSQNITSSQTSGYRKRTVNFSTQTGGELHIDKRSHVGSDAGMPMSFPKVNLGINFMPGETQPTKRELDVAIQSEGFFELKSPDGSLAYTRSGQFQLRADRTIVTGSGAEVMSDSGAPIVAVSGSGAITINRDGTIMQGDSALGKLAVRKFPNNAELTPLAGGLFAATGGGQAQQVEAPELMQGYVEGSNVNALREMVDLVLISRAYEANQRIIKAVDDQMQKTLDAIG